MVREEQRAQSRKGGLGLYDGAQTCGRRQEKKNAGPVFVEVLGRQLAETASGIADDDALLRDAIEDHEVVAVILAPVRDRGKRNLRQSFASAANGPRLETDFFGGGTEACKVCPLPVGAGELTKP